MDLKIVNQMSSDELLRGFSFVVRRERETMVEVVVYLAEMKRRRLYAEEGYSSLFSFLTEKYRYSRGGAYRRIQAAKVALLFPEILDELRSGRLNLISLCLIEPYLTRTDGKKLIEGVIGKKKEEIEYILSNMFPREEKTKDKIRRLPVIIREERGRDGSESHFVNTPGNTNKERCDSHGKTKDVGTFSSQSESKEEQKRESGSYSHSGSREDQKTEFHSHSGSGESKTREVRRVKIEFMADEEVAELIGRAKELLRHKYPKGRLEDLVREAFELLLQKKDPMRKGERAKELNKSKPAIDREKSVEKKEIQGPETVERKRATPQGNTKTRYIPERIRREIWKRDGGICAFVGREGKRCDEKNFLQIDHVRAWALGGESVPDNLQLLCVTHNQLRAEKTFGHKMAGIEGV